MEPLVVSWEQEQGFPLAVEYQGAADYTPWLSAPVGVYTLRTLGWEAVRAHNTALVEYGQRVIGAALGLAPTDLPQPTVRESAMRLVPLPSGVATNPADAVALRLMISEKLAAETAVNAWNGRGLLRLSAQVYNRPADYDRLAERLPALLTPLRR